MSDSERPKKKRWSKRAVRGTAWAAGGATFLSALGAFGSSPPVASVRAAEASNDQRVVVRRIVKRIVIVRPANAAPAGVVQVGGATGGGAGTAPAPPPAPAPVSTGGS